MLSRCWLYASANRIHEAEGSMCSASPHACACSYSATRLQPTSSCFYVGVVRTIGADFHTTMVATAPGEKLLIWRCPVRNWSQLKNFSLFHCELRVIIYRRHWCRDLQSAVSKPTAHSATTRAALFDSNMHRIVCRFEMIKAGKGVSSSFAVERKRKVGAYDENYWKSYE